MSLCASRISLYWLDDTESYLGEERCIRPSTSWFRLGSDAHGTLALATAHIFFDDGVNAVTVFPLQYAEDVALHEADGQLVLSFTCKRAVRRDALPRTGAQPAVPGVCVPFPNSELWVFRVPCESEWFVESLRRLVAHQRMDDLLSRREIALQSAPSTVSFRTRRQVPMREQQGVLHITPTHALFEPLFPLVSHGSVALRRGECVHTFPRWIVFEAIGLDLYTSPALDRAPALSLIFNNTRERDQARDLLFQLLGVPPYSVSPHTTTEAWKRGEMSNYDYLLHLNKWASRSFNDVFQYPVFPWVLTDYSSPQLDLSTPAAFRDLRKPIGALSPDRLAMLQERARFLDEAEERKYLYSTHYSSAGVVAYYLVRPHPEFQLCLQGGSLDVAERVMESVPQVWRSVTTNTSNFRELIPEFFNGDFTALCGPPRIALGTHSSGRPVLPFVELPPWAADPREFVGLHRAALESDHVSCHLHSWIDLIFGVAQSGELARAADNVFHPFSHRQLTAKQVSVPGLHLSSHEYAREFGNVPMQLFNAPHPSRKDSKLTVQCTFEALETCGGGGSSGSAVDPSAFPEHQRIAEMMKALQSADEDLEEEPRPLPVLSAIEDSHFSSPPAMLTEVATTPLTCTSARFVTVGFGERHTQSAALRSDVVVLVVGDDGRVVSLFDAQSGERLRTFPDFDGRITSTAYQAGSMYVFTENHTCYTISLNSHAVTHCFTELTDAPVVHACFLPSTAFLADAEARLMLWVARREDERQVEDGTFFVHTLFDFPPSYSCEASSRIICLGGAARTRAVVAISARLEAYLFHDGLCEESALRTVPEEKEVLNAAVADEAPYFWVFYRCEAVLYDVAGLWVRRVPFPAASEVVCAHVHRRLYPLCIYADELPVRVRILHDTDERVVQMQYCRAVRPRTSCAASTLAFLGRSIGDAASSLVLTLTELKECSAE